MLQVNFDPFPDITTERLLLRQVNAGDANEMFWLRSNEQVMKYIGRPRPKTVEEVLPFIQKIIDNATNNEGVAWAITLRDDPTLIGHISFHVLMKEHHRAEVGYLLHPAHHGKGLVDEALQAILAYGFNTMGLHSVEAITSPENKASRKLLERNGFVQEGYFKENFYWEGRFLDSVVYSLLKPSAE